MTKDKDNGDKASEQNSQGTAKNREANTPQGQKDANGGSAQGVK